MNNWKIRKLGELIVLQRGHDLTVSNIVAGPYPVAGSNGIIGYHNEFTTSGPGLTLGRSGNSIGVAHYYESDFWAHNTTLYAKEFRNSHPKFMYYLLKFIDLSGHNSGSAVPSLNRNFINPYEVLVPDLGTQERVASILSALDDKIELNRQMNKTLEQMAQTLFRQYFVEPLFLANREENGIALQEAENLPSGWKMGKVGEVSYIQNGFAFKSKDFLEEGQNGVIKIRNINGNVVDVHSTQFIDDKVAATIAPRFHVSSGDILIAMTGAEVGKIGIVPNTEKKLFLNQRVGSFKERISNGNYFTYLLLTSEAYQAELQTTAMGSAQPNISGNDIESIKCALPNSEVITEFGEQVKPLFDKILQNLKENFLLSTTRDTLLPKLMSGEINVLQAAKTGAYEPEQVLSGGRY